MIRSGTGTGGASPYPPVLATTCLHETHAQFTTAIDPLSIPLRVSPHQPLIPHFVQRRPCTKWEVKGERKGSERASWSLLT